MDWLKGMNDVARYIEEHLTDEIAHASLSRIVGVSTHEFSRIFSFMAGMPLSEYIRRRRLTQAAFDIHTNGKYYFVQSVERFYRPARLVCRRQTKSLRDRDVQMNLNISPGSWSET